jgi:uncharacterized membrane protein YfcA
VAVTVAGVLVLVSAGVLAGVVSTVVSLASLISYPTLLAVGLPPLSANVTNTVALTFTGIGSVFGSRAELSGQGRRVLRLGVLTALGGGAGAALLLLTPARAFQAAAPWLVGAASALLLAQPPIRRLARARGRDRSAMLHAGVFGTAVYVGYFGAAGGILMLAVLAPMLDQPLARINAVKNAISGLANGVAAVGFAAFGPVQWAAAAPLAAGFLAGGWLGPAFVRRLPGEALRVLVGSCGLLVAVMLGLDTYR